MTSCLIFLKYLMPSVSAVVNVRLKKTMHEKISKLLTASLYLFNFDLCFLI